MEDINSETGRLTQYVPYILLAIVLGFVLFVRIRLLQAPMERDEGEYAYMGQLLLKGIPPYVNAYTMKLPGVSFVYALFMALFGQTTAGIHMGLLVVNSISIYLVFLLARRVLDKDAAVISCATYAVLSLSQSVYGVFAHATHFVVLFSLAGFLLLLHYIDRGRLFALCASGVCFGLAFIMKQHSVLMICCAFLYLVWHGWKKPVGSRKKLLVACVIFLSGTIIPYALVVLYVLKAGVLGKFWFWTVKYAREYVSEQTLEQGWNNFAKTFKRIVEPQMPFWLLAGGGLAALFTKQGSKTDRLFILGLFFFSFLSICPGLYFREHYFILLLPAVALMVGAAARTAGHFLSSLQMGRFQQFIPVLLLITAVAYGIYHERNYYFFFEPQQVTRSTYGPSPFNEAVQVARYIKEHTSADDRIAVLGSEPEIFFYADRLSATRHIYMYGLMEKQSFAVQMQSEMIREIEMAKPKYIVMVNLPSSWGEPPFFSRTIIEWGEKYAAEQYDVVGVIDIVDFDTTHYLWDDKATGYVPISDVFLSVLKRKGNT
ncbi:MAG: glycosyltransferase family 39 protein [Desulfuromonadaceae bacterium]